MAKFEFVGDGELAIPSLGLTLAKGDQFDGPDDVINLANIQLVSKPSKASAQPDAGSAPDLTVSEPSVTADAPVSTDPASN
jgi:hypothetical protein